MVVAWQDFLSSKLEVSAGEIFATGTMIPVTVILDNLAETLAPKRILTSYPSLSPVHIKAALAYAAELAHEEKLLPMSPCEVQTR